MRLEGKSAIVTGTGSGIGKAIKNFNINNDEMGQMIAEIDLQKKKLEDVVAAWMQKNQSRWSQWLQ